MDLISVIVPVYKVEKYLRKCVDSILAQTYTNLEIILVDDGSPDNCGRICDEYANKDSRIKVVHQKNGGLSAARNAGLDIAKGEYIGFVDSDDYIAPDMYEKLYEAVTMNNADMSICGMSYFDEDGNSINYKCPLSNRIYSKREIFGELQGESYWFYIVACPKLYKTPIFKELRFHIGKHYEDNLLIHYIYNKCTRIATIESKLYYVTERAGSITHSGTSVKELDDIDAFIDRINYYKTNGYDECIVSAKKKLIYHYQCFIKKFRLVNSNEKQTIKYYDKLIFSVFESVKTDCNWKTKLFFKHRLLYMFLFKLKRSAKGMYFKFKHPEQNA